MILGIGNVYQDVVLLSPLPGIGRTAYAVLFSTKIREWYLARIRDGGWWWDGVEGVNITVSALQWNCAPQDQSHMRAHL